MVCTIDRRYPRLDCVSRGPRHRTPTAIDAAIPAFAQLTTLALLAFVFVRALA